MRAIKIFTEDGRALADKAWNAITWSERSRGWLGKNEAQAGEALLLSPASSIHSFGMRFAFDLVYLDRSGKVLKLRAGMRPGRVSLGPLGPWLRGGGLQALELPPGSIKAWSLQVGQTLKFEDRP